jgi:fructokinase
MKILVCGEALMDVFAQRATTTGMALDAHVGGSPFNVAIGLARFGQAVGFLGALSNSFIGQRLRLALEVEGVDLRHAVTVDAPATLAMVSLDTSGSASYAFYGAGGADRQLLPEHLPSLGDEVAALHFGSYSMVVEPVASTHRRLIAQACTSKVISYDANLRMQVEPDLARWTDTVQWMARHVHLLKLSAEDLEFLRPGLSLRQCADEWLELGVSLVVITAGALGAHAFSRNHSITVPAQVVEVVDTVGAGDTFQSAMLAWLAESNCLNSHALATLSHKQLHAVIAFSSAAAAITCTRRGADMPRRQDLLGHAF